MVRFERGDWAGLESTVGDLRTLVAESPDTPFCLLGGAAFGYGAAGGLLAGRQLPGDIDDVARRMLFATSDRVPAALVMLPKVMTANGEALAKGLRAYQPGLRLSERYRVWDVADLIPAISLTILERWDALPQTLARLDEFAAGGCSSGRGRRIRDPGRGGRHARRSSSRPRAAPRPRLPRTQ